MKNLIIISAFLILLCTPALLFAQPEPNQKPTPEMEFQDAFYESLLQKGIENNDKAIVALEKCLELQPENATVYSELGRNYLAQKDYKNAFISFEKAAKIDPTNKWFLVGMYDVCYETKEYLKAIDIVTKLIEFKKEYKEDLVSLYMNTQQFDKALDLINELNEKVGKSELRDNYKYQILQEPEYQSMERINLINQIKKYPKEESNYIALIALYYKNNLDEKALELSKLLSQEIPTSDWAQVNLFQLYLISNDDANVVKSMNFVLASSKIDSKIKHRMLNEFLIYSNNKPQLDLDLDKAISFFDNDKEVAVAKEVGKFYHSKGNTQKAIRFYELYLSKNNEDIEAALLLLEAYTETAQFDVIIKKANEWIQIFPSQPQFYYFAGLGNNQLLAFKKAKELLETGLDFVVDNPALEINFYIQLGEAFSGLGDNNKKEMYFSKAENALKQTRK
jgi:tetratricopeptide (TPR) repeat protein